LSASQRRIKLYIRWILHYAITLFRLIWQTSFDIECFTDYAHILFIGKYGLHLAYSLLLQKLFWTAMNLSIIISESSDRVKKLCILCHC